MTKQDLIDQVADAIEIPKTKAALAVDTLLDSIRDALTKEDEVQLVGFGTFGVRRRKARVGRNPRTGQALTIPASRGVFFRVGRKLKEAVANKKK